MDIPTYLKHKPIVYTEGYASVDANHKEEDTDVRGLSLGLAQWNDEQWMDGCIDISAKIWRHTGEKWSRQSEEMPLHRVLDLAIIICNAYAFLQNSSEDADNACENHIGEITQGSRESAVKVRGGKDITNARQLFFNILKQETYLEDRFLTLSNALKKILDAK